MTPHPHRQLMTPLVKAIGFWESKFTWLLVCLLATLVAYPMVESLFAVEEELLRLLFISLLLTAIYPLSDSRGHLIAAIALGVPIVILNLLALFHWLPQAIPLRMALTLGFNLFAIYTFLSHILRRSERVTMDTLNGAICVYLLLGITWGIAYQLVETLQPGSISFLPGHNPDGIINWNDLVYFSFMTLTNVGYGDLAPVSNLTRSLAVLEAVVGVMYITILVARLVGLYRVEGFEPPLVDDDYPIAD